MHPNTRFQVADRDALFAAAADIGFAHVFVSTEGGPMVAHAPITPHGQEMRFHLARGNPVARHLDGARLMLSLVGAHGYVSPNWYAMPGDQVPTWNYVGIEIEGVARAIDEAALIAQVDRLASLHEPRVNPAAPWSRGKMDDDVFARMLRGIRGFAVSITAIHGTAKLSQNKSAADRTGVVAGLEAGGNEPLAAAMRAEGVA